MGQSNPSFTNLSLDNQAKLVRSSWCKQYTFRVIIQLGVNLETDQDRIKYQELCGILQMMRHQGTHALAYHLIIYQAETACMSQHYHPVQSRHAFPYS